MSLSMLAASYSRQKALVCKSKPGRPLISMRDATYLLQEINQLRQGLIGPVLDFVPLESTQVLIDWLYRQSEPRTQRYLFQDCAVLSLHSQINTKLETYYH